MAFGHEAFDVREEPILDAREPEPRFFRIREVSGAHRLGRRGERVPDRLADADAAAPVTAGAARELANAVGGLMEGRDDQRVAADRQARERVDDALRGEDGGLDEERGRVERDVPREDRLHAGHEGPGPELRERVMAAVGRDDVVARLRPAVEADDDGRAVTSDQKIGDEPLAGVAEAEVDDDVRAPRHSLKAFMRRCVHEPIRPCTSACGVSARAT